MKRLYTVSVCYRTRIEAESDGEAIREASVPVPSEKGVHNLAIAVIGANKIMVKLDQQPSAETVEKEQS